MTRIVIVGDYRGRVLQRLLDARVPWVADQGSRGSEALARNLGALCSQRRFIARGITIGGLKG